MRRVAGLLLIGCFFSLTFCSKTHKHTYQGYIEAENMYLSSPYSGRLTELLVSRGQTVNKGQLIFSLDDNPQALVIKESEAQLIQAKKVYKDLENPKRLPEVQAIEAQVGQTKAQLKLAQVRLSRYQKLYDAKVINKDVLDEFEAKYEELLHLKEQYEANLALSKQGSRQEQLNAQKATIEALEAKLQQAKWQLQQKKVYAPDNGIIFDTYYQPGEFVAVEQPVASLITPEHMYIEFFVSSLEIPYIQLNKNIQFTLFGSETLDTGTIVYISPEVEYLPPLVYSRENENKLVFRIKARLKNPKDYKPGEPVEVIVDGR